MLVLRPTLICPMLYWCAPFRGHWRPTQWTNCWRCFTCCGTRRQCRVNKTTSAWAKVQKVNKLSGSQSGRTVRSRRPAQPSWRSSDWCCCSGLRLHWPGSGGPGCEDLQVRKSCMWSAHLYTSHTSHPSAADASFTILTIKTSQFFLFRTNKQTWACLKASFRVLNTSYHSLLISLHKLLSF